MPNKMGSAAMIRAGRPPDRTVIWRAGIPFFAVLTFAALPRAPGSGRPDNWQQPSWPGPGSRPGAAASPALAPPGCPDPLPRVAARSSNPPPRGLSGSQARDADPKKMITSVAASGCATRLLLAVKAVEVWWP
jgi:hypothetical protein